MPQQLLREALLVLHRFVALEAHLPVPAAQAGPFHAHLLAADIHRPGLGGPLIEAFAPRLVIRAGALLPLGVEDEFRQLPSQLQGQLIERLAARLQDVMHPLPHLFLGRDLPKSGHCLFPILRYYIHRGSCLLFSYFSVVDTTPGATLQISTEFRITSSLRDVEVAPSAAIVDKPVMDAVAVKIIPHDVAAVDCLGQCALGSSPSG